jgi:glycerol-3-phosphate dehydrogenase (NAD(P)+)
MKVAILGAGAWGSALAISLASRHATCLWARDPDGCERIRSTRESPYLPGMRLPQSVRIDSDLSSALAGVDLVLVATATAGLRSVAAAVAERSPEASLLWACKGFEAGSPRFPHEIVAEALPRARAVGALSGPSFAVEVAQGLPAALVLASRDGDFAAGVATALNGARLRIYSSEDLVGVELGGAAKNVIAIAAGISDGLGLGLNARAALITRGLAEITRLGLALGGRAATFAGLAGLGDLVLTCTGELSRNREVGRQLAGGRSLPSVLESLGHVAEGVHSAGPVLRLAKSRGVEMPIASAVHAILHEGLEPRLAVESLLSRDPKPESA